MIDLNKYINVPVVNNIAVKMANLIDPKDLTHWEYIKDGELYANISGPYFCLMRFSISTVYSRKYTKLTNYSSILILQEGDFFSKPMPVEIKASSTEYTHTFYISKEKEALFKIIIPNFPTLDVIDYDDYMKRKYKSIEFL